jgi:hypothetical protein
MIEDKLILRYLTPNPNGPVRLWKSMSRNCKRRGWLPLICKNGQAGYHLRM